jgi:undecaprenyl-diphosphatase
MHTAVIDIAKYGIAVPALLVLIVWLRVNWSRKLRFIVLIIVSGAVAYAGAKLAGHLYYDPRPFVVGHFKPYFPHSTDNGFVSDHTLLGSVLAFACFRYSHTAGYLAIIAAVLVGSARVVAGVHHIQDVIGALVVAGISVLVVNLIMRHWLHVNDRKAAANLSASERRPRG